MKKITIGSEGRGSWGLYWVIKSIREKFKDCEIILPPYTTQWSPDLITGKFNNIIVKENSSECDFVIKSNFEYDEPNWNTSSKKYIYWSGESYGPTRSEYESEHINLLTGGPFDEKTAYMPFFMYSPFLYKDKYANHEAKKKRIAYCNNNLIQIREDIFNFFVEKIGANSCSSLGNCFGKYQETNKKIEAFWFHEKLIKEYSEYDFIIAMENKVYEGYVTEKILNAYCSGGVPIYWGDSKFAKMFFNKNSFIDASDFKNLEECVEYVCKLKKTEIDYLTSQPHFNKIEGIDARQFLYKKCSEKINKFLFN
jgi:hypothetical protein